VSNASLVLGVAGAAAPSSFVLLSGVAGLLAGALSMAAGEYVSVRSQREMYEYQIALEREEIAEYPEEEAEELALIYAARGVALAQAREVSQALLARPEQALDVLSREELGLNPDDLGSPLGAAAASFLSFAAGATVPLVPFLIDMTGPGALAATAVLTLVALFDRRRCRGAGFRRRPRARQYHSLILEKPRLRPQSTEHEAHFPAPRHQSGGARGPDDRGPPVRTRSVARGSR
jgi:VIT1/CCC1 family predicted Fe2+/Mn2+ transporter